jgi:hypothetical protein
MLIILPNHTNTVVLGRGAKTSKIAPLEEEVERQQEATRYDPRAAEEPPPFAYVTTPTETPRFDEVYAEEVGLPLPTTNAVENWNRIRDEGEAFIKAVGRTLEDADKDDEIEEAAVSLPTKVFGEFKVHMNDMILVNKQLRKFKKKMKEAEARAREIQNQAPVEELKAKIEQFDQMKENLTDEIFDWEDTNDVVYEDLVKEFDGPPQAYITYE